MVSTLMSYVISLHKCGGLKLYRDIAVLRASVAMGLITGKTCQRENSFDVFLPLKKMVLEAFFGAEVNDVPVHIRYTFSKGTLFKKIPYLM